MASPSPKPYSNNTIKFLCSYGGKILPRYPDGQLRYHGGQTRLLSVDRSLSFSELLLKLGEMCGSSNNSVCLRCQLPTEDLDSLVSITSDEDLVNLVEEYDRFALSKSFKIKAFLSRNSNSKSGSESSGSSTATIEAVSPKSSNYGRLSRCKYHVLTPKKAVQSASSSSGNSYRFYGNSRSYLVHSGNYWQQ